MVYRLLLFGHYAGCDVVYTPSLIRSMSWMGIVTTGKEETRQGYAYGGYRHVEKTCGVYLLGSIFPLCSVHQVVSDFFASQSSTGWYTTRLYSHSRVS